MKTAAKTFIIIAMIITFWMIYPIIVGSIALSKLNSSTEKSQLVGIGVCTIIFCSQLGGIFMLCIPESEFKGKAESVAAETVTAETLTTGAKELQKSNVIEDLQQLKTLFDDGIISEEDYNRKRQEYLDRI